MLKYINSQGRFQQEVQKIMNIYIQKRRTEEKKSEIHEYNQKTI